MASSSNTFSLSAPGALGISRVAPQASPKSTQALENAGNETSFDATLKAQEQREAAQAQSRSREQGNGKVETDSGKDKPVDGNSLPLDDDSAQVAAQHDESSPANRDVEVPSATDKAIDDGAAQSGIAPVLTASPIAIDEAGSSTETGVETVFAEADVPDVSASEAEIAVQAPVVTGPNDKFSTFQPRQGELAAVVDELPLQERRAAIPLAVADKLVRHPAASGEGVQIADDVVESSLDTGNPDATLDEHFAVKTAEARAAELRGQELKTAESRLVDTRGALDNRNAPVTTAISQGTTSLHSPLHSPQQAAGSERVFFSQFAIPVGDTRWDGEFAGQVRLMVGNGMKDASIQLSPPDLGRLDIRITTDGDETRVHFTVHNASARDAIESAMPRLKDLLEQGGLQLVHSQVSDQSQSGQGWKHGAEPRLNRLFAQGESGSGDELIGVHGAAGGTSAIDYYI